MSVFIPELESYLNLIRLPNYDCLVQNNLDRCEMIGVKSNLFYKIFKFTTKYDHIEDYYKHVSSSLKKLQCKQFFIESTQRGGENEIYDNI